ncbi:MAG TPA: ABC transporter permease [Tepidisphaeraceae bacterium]|nr:ABC transporter permease [Tepidisphaeraceae bacterium]
MSVTPAPAAIAAGRPGFFRRLAGASPFGPIFGKELRTTARRKRNYVLRVVYLAALLLTMLAVWSATSSRFYYGSLAAQAQAQAELGSQFFACFTIFSVIAMAAIGPVVTSTAVGAERLAKTLHVLLMTPITAWQVVSGKLFSRLLVPLTLIGLSLPVLALVRLLGGVELWQMAGAVAVCVVTALTTASIGLFFSVFMNRAFAVILLSYAAILFLYAFVPFVLAVGFDIDGRGTEKLYAAINWMVCAAMLAEPSGSLSGINWVPCVAIHLALSAVLVAASAMLLRYTTRHAGESAPAGEPAATEPEPSAPVDEAASLATSPPPLPAPGAAAQPAPAPKLNHHSRRKAAARAREVSDHPVLWREVRRPLTTRRWQAVVATLAAVGILLSTYVMLASENDLMDEETHMGYAWVFNALVWLLVSVLSATVIAQEKESDTWTLLLTTPLSGESVVWGKVLGLFRRMMWPAVLIVSHFALFTISGAIDVGAFFVALWVIFSFNTVWIATGVYLSLRLKRVTFAVILNLMLAIVLYLGVFVVLLIVSELVSNSDLVEAVLWYNPYYYMAMGMDDVWRWGYPRRIDLPNDVKVGYVGYLGVLLLVGSLHVALSALLLQWTARRFDRIVGRAEQQDPLGPVPPAGPFVPAAALR